MSDISVTLPPEEDPLWLFSREEISNSPSRVDQVTSEEEDECRKGASAFIQSVGLQLRLPQLTMATALLFYHRFFALNSLKHYPLLDMSTACLFVAAKLEETPKKLKEVIIVAHSVQHPDQPLLSIDLPEFKRERDKILSLERALLQAICFDFQIDHPYRYLLHYVKQLQGGKELAQSAWSFANDSFRTTLPLQYYARTIAAGCIYLAVKRFVQDKTELEWSKLLGMDLEVLDDIGRQLMDLYKDTKEDEIDKNPTDHHTKEDQEKRQSLLLSSVVDHEHPMKSPSSMPLPPELSDGPQSTKKSLVTTSHEIECIPMDVSSPSRNPNDSQKEPSHEQPTRKESPHPRQTRERDHHDTKYPSTSGHDISRKTRKEDRHEKSSSSSSSYYDDRSYYHDQRHRSRDRSGDRGRTSHRSNEYHGTHSSRHDDDDRYRADDYYRGRSPHYRYEDEDGRKDDEHYRHYYRRKERDYEPHQKESYHRRDYSRDKSSSSYRRRN